MVKFIKLRTILLVGLLITSVITFAQFSLGGRLGVNMANLRGSSVENGEMMIGYNIGGLVNYGMNDLSSGSLSEILSFQAELTVQTKGTTADYKVIDPSPELAGENVLVIEDIKQEFTYVQVPVLAKFTFGDDRSLLYFGEAGFFGASLFGLEVDGKKSRNHDNDNDTDKRKYRDEYSGFDYGVVMGAGIAIPFGGRNSPWSAYANLRYSLGLNNIGEYKDATIDIPEEHLEDIKTNTLSLLFGVAYKL